LQECVAGALLDTGSHGIDALTYLFGRDCDVVHAEMTCNEAGADTSANVSLSWRDGIRGDVVLEDRDVEASEVHIVGSKGTIDIDERGAILNVGSFSVGEPAVYVQRPVDDLLALENGGAVFGARLDESQVVVDLISQAYKRAGRPLPGPWLRPRFKPLARRNGAC
jgi:predicted dehydrogenase